MSGPINKDNYAKFMKKNYSVFMFKKNIIMQFFLITIVSLVSSVSIGTN